MKSTVNKGIVFYIFLLLAVIVGVACVFVAILIFSPGTEIFGISYINNNVNSEILYSDSTLVEQSEYIDTLIEIGKIKTININTEYSNVNVLNEESIRTRIDIDGKITGIVKSGEQKNRVVSYNYNEEEQSYTINISEPKCLLYFSNNASLSLVFPYEYNKKDLNINITTQSGDVYFGVDTKSNLTFNSVNVKCEESTNIKFGKYAQITNSVVVDSPSGTITFDSTLYDGTSSINVNNLEVITENAKIIGGYLNAKNVDLKTLSSQIKIDKIKGNLTYKATKGVLLIDILDGFLNCEEDVIIANIEISTVYGDVLLPQAETSDITIGKLYSECLIRTSSGNVTINEMYATSEIETNNGKININVKSDDNFVNPSKQITTNLKTNSGDINVNFDNIINDNVISTTKGNVNCNFKKTLNLVLNYSCNKNAPTLSSGITTLAPEKEATYYYGCSVQSPSLNKMSITNNEGKTDIKDIY